MRLISAAFAMIVGFFAAELAVRLLGTTDADGNFYFRGAHVGAVSPQVEWVRSKIDQYRDSDETRMIYDPQTGWSPRPGLSSHAGMYKYNSLGIRSAPSEYSETPGPEVWRIALFGDSFTHGDDVPFDETWGYLLERRLKKSGINAEVINFGVSAYGMDQAYLRWRHLGKRFKPHIVLFGFQAENINRNVNILRGFYAFNTGIPFSKPRFRIDQNGRLAAVNLPTMPIDQVPEVMGNMENWKDVEYEWFYNPDDFRRRFWHASKFISLIVDRINHKTANVFSTPQPTYPPKSKAAQVTKQILTEFREDVRSQGGRFFIVHLPKKSDIARAMGGKPLVYEPLLAEIERTFPVIDPFNALYDVAITRQKEIDTLFAKNKRHYSKRGNTVIAETIAESLSTEWYKPARHTTD